MENAKEFTQKHLFSIERVSAVKFEEAKNATLPLMITRTIQSRTEVGRYKKMKFVSDKKTLLSLILPAASAASNKSTLPALEGLLFKLEGETLTICGYDLEKGVRTTGTVVPMESGSVIINA